MELDDLRRQVRAKYTEVATNPDPSVQFQPGRTLAKMLGYPDEWVEELPESSIESFAGSGNPFSMGNLSSGEVVLDVGCGAGFDSLIAARQVGSSGRVLGVDMTPAMIEKATAGAGATGLANVEFRLGHAESLPLASGAVDVVISNGVINLCPDKKVVLSEINRVLKPGGRLQVGDIIVHSEIPEDAKADIDLWGA